MFSNRSGHFASCYRGSVIFALVGLRIQWGPYSLFSVDWLVLETLEYNLLALTCSLKKALSTGIRLSWQGQLRLALSLFMSLFMCLYHAAVCLLPLTGEHVNNVFDFHRSLWPMHSEENINKLTLIKFTASVKAIFMLL